LPAVDIFAAVRANKNIPQWKQSMKFMTEAWKKRVDGGHQPQKSQYG